MTISCIIPTCDRKDYLFKTIESVLLQTIQPDEILIINNGINSVELPADIAGKIKIYNIIPYIGVAQARNFGACLAKGDYLAFLDDDDLWDKEYLKKVTVAINNDNPDIIISRLDHLYGDEVKLFRNPHGNISINNILVANPGITGSNIVISKKVFYNLKGFDPKLPPSEDKSLILEALIKNFKIVTLPENQVMWRQHDKTPRLTDSSSMVEGIWQFTRKYKKLMSKMQYLENWKKIYAHQYSSGKKTAYIKFLVLFIILKFLKLFIK